jgi:hypothetical protein
VELILVQEGSFVNTLGAVVFDKPRVSYWMVLVPILFLHFIYQMQKYKRGRAKFAEDFLITRRGALQAAYDAAVAGKRPDTGPLIRQAGLSDALRKPYAEWVEVLTGHYADLLAGTGDSFDGLVRSVYRGRTDYLLALNRLSTVEEAFYAALKPQMAATEGAADIIDRIEANARRLRSESAQRIFA